MFHSRLSAGILFLGSMARSRVLISGVMAVSGSWQMPFSFNASPMPLTASRIFLYSTRNSALYLVSLSHASSISAWASSQSVDVKEEPFLADIFKRFPILWVRGTVTPTHSRYPFNTFSTHCWRW